MTNTDLIRSLDDFDPAARRAALNALQRNEGISGSEAALPPGCVNLHMHTFFSFNGEQYSPSHIAWLARERGLAVAGVVDFDVLDAVEEFLEACRLLDVRCCAGIETRVFVPEFKDAVINSPGEPGIAYHMGAGMASRKLDETAEAFLQSLRDTAARRNQELIGRVNAFTDPLMLDYARDVLPTTPNGNATERHICKAYAMKAAELYPNPEALAAFWTDKLGQEVSVDDLPAQPGLLDRIRAKTMKRGGAGYVAPDANSFPLLKDMNEFVLRAGGIPCLTWLDGLSDGEQRIEEWMDVCEKAGAMAINIIPDRNYTPGVQDQKLQNLQTVIALAEQRDWPILVGTEMNAPGQKFVDSFETAELAPFVPIFLKGALILYAHTLLQRYEGKGYLSDWATTIFPERKDRNNFFEALGRAVSPSEPETVWTVAERLL